MSTTARLIWLSNCGWQEDVPAMVGAEGCHQIPDQHIRCPVRKARAAVITSTIISDLFAG